jgi:metal-responsive CopG/Arc/MetJ family transcriptional regulator
MTWKAVLVDAPTQAGKTNKCFEVISEKMSGIEKCDNLIIFITQANSIASVDQILQRVPTHSKLKNIFDSDNIFRAKDIPETFYQGNYMIVDFWNLRNTKNILEMAKNTTNTWDNVFIIIDEVDQGNLNGIKERLWFVHQVEKRIGCAEVKVIFITATVANLSKRILQIANTSTLFRSGIIRDIVRHKVVEHQFATPHESYIGASWFLQNKDVWTELEFSVEHKNEKETEVLEQICRLSDAHKEMTLIVTSNLTADHESLADRLTRIGYNVVVQMNNANGKNLKVKYVEMNGKVSEWNIPFNKIYTEADNGNLSSFIKRDIDENKLNIKTGILSKKDLNITHILQAALFMDCKKSRLRIKQNIPESEFNRLECISRLMDNGELKRPNSFPENPRVAIIAGYMAGRGITIQNPYIDFVCTSYCFTDVCDNIHRGANNAQRFGRACGLIGDVFARRDVKPVMIATKNILKASVANEAALNDLAKKINNGDLVKLKDLITQDDWCEILKTTTKSFKGAKTDGEYIDGVDMKKFREWMKPENTTVIGKMVKYLYNNKNNVTIDELKNGINYLGSDQQFMNRIDHGRSIKAEYGMLWHCKKSIVNINKNIV